MLDRSKHKKLLGKGKSWISFSRLSEEEDHLLFVTSVGWLEKHKRFYYGDIHSVVTVLSADYVAWMIILSLLTLFTGVAYLTGGRWFSAVAFIILVIILIIHLVRGGTCKCWIETDVNKQRLNMFGRVKQVEKFMARIEPRIRDAQGAFSLEEMKEEPSKVIFSTPAPALSANESHKEDW